MKKFRLGNSRKVIKADILEVDKDHFKILRGKEKSDAKILYADNNGIIEFLYDNKFYSVKIEKLHNIHTGSINGVQFNLEEAYPIGFKPKYLRKNAEEFLDRYIESSMGGRVVAVYAKAGKYVKKHEVLSVVQSMKMQNSIKSPRDGTIKNVMVKENENISRGYRIVEFE